MDVTRDPVEILLQNQEYFLAQAILQKEIDAESSEVSNYCKLAESFLNQGYPEEAIKCYKHIEKLGHPHLSYSLIGDTHYQNDSFEQATNSYLEALLYDCSDAAQLFKVYKNLGNCFLKQAQVDEAEQFYLKAYALAPHSDDLLVNLATLDLQRADETKALEKLREAIKLNDSNDKAWTGLALIYDLFGDTELALACTKKAIELSPSNLNALHIYAQMGVKMQKPEMGIELFEQWIAKNDFNVTAYLCLIELYIRNNDFFKARYITDFALLWQPKNLALVTWSESLKSHGI